MGVLRTKSLSRNEADHLGQIVGPIRELLGERRRRDLVGAQAIVEVAPEPAGPHLLGKVAIRRRDDLALEGAGLRVADSLKLPRLQHTEQFHLNRRIELADLVEEDCSVLTTLFQPALSVPEGSGKGPFDVPAAFVNRTPLLVDILQEELPARHFRLSMGIQTFDPDRLKQMGRLGFGDTETFRNVVKLGHERGFTVSGDMLFNLPAQSLEEMKSDVRQAVEIGLDHLGLYHLVMFDGLGTPWSRDPALLAALPSNSVAASNWLELREMLLGLGFHQTTLTNFERQELQGRDERFVYEELSFRPDHHDMIGFGPTGISLVDTGMIAVRVINPVDASSYIAAVETGRPAWDRAFVYDPTDLQVFHLTRRIAALRISRSGYRSFFGSDPVGDFPQQFQAFQEEGLIRMSDGSIEPTPLGMFYSDSMAGLLAIKAMRARRADRSWADLSGPVHVRGNDNGPGHM